MIEAVSGFSEATLEIIGAGPQAGALASLSASLGLTDRVHFRGFVDQQDIPELYRSFDVIAVPSLPFPGWQEQFCRVAVEAMASGIPVVASETGALPEVVGSSGLFVPPGDTQALRDALRRMLDEPDLWRRKRQAALDRAPEYSWLTVAKSHRQLYEDTVDN